MYNFIRSQWTLWCSLRAHSALIITVSYKQGASFFFCPPPLRFLAPYSLNLVSKVPLLVAANVSIHTNLLANYNALIYRCVVRSIYQV